MEIKLDNEKQAELVQKIQRFFLEEKNEEIDENQAVHFLRFMLQETGYYLYSQALEDSHLFIAQKIENILGIKRNPVQ
ncbi:hypothetical protein P22_0905 [Propionispora sp. 2/2-37]|uniref:DUF2164 family protein n=1 Tax=Propionispora sp. 2/2-37 TaxID=1677858 RepID=UPI0006BB7AAD|nr:DUF2164 family protein [Propionispora sp. 2/2-37]CUH94839.1 hypothetical protein P22_0905 [Propionispora sp. 2/2-37]